MKRKLGCTTWGASLDARLETIRLLADTGFETIMLPMFLKDRQTQEKIHTLIEDLGMTVDTLHSPFDQINHIWFDDADGDSMTALYKECIDFCADVKADTMVLHDSSGRICPDMSCAGLARFREIFLYAQEKGIRIAMENLRRTNYIGRIFHENRDLPLHFCWDSGHEQCYTPGVEHLALFPEKLICTHIHDNSGIYTHDDHWLPFDGVCNWEKKASLIKQSGYSGALTLELARGSVKYAHMTDSAYAKEAFERLSRFAKMCE